MNLHSITHKILNFGEDHHKPEPINDFYIDSPHSFHINSETVHIEGWIVPNDGHTVKSMRAVNNGNIHSISYGKVRVDVSSSHPGSSSECGFEADFIYKDGDLIIEADLGEGFTPIFSTKISYSPEKMVDMIMNPRLAEFMADHENLLEAKSKYFYEPNNPTQIKSNSKKAKLIAFYLPQFHPIPVNDAVWGPGFTEWTNVTKAVPKFVGHQQPLLPSGLGFYDLRVADTIKLQIDLAKSHGIYGFCFYYYWFSGKKVLETPIETFLAHKEWDFNFTICWANENWTKRWDGRENDIILSQEYHENDPLNFIKEVAPILNDPRYITKDGKPVLTVYRASELKNPKHYAATWRAYFKKTYNKDLYLVSSMCFEVNDPREYGFDIGLDFSPQTNFFKASVFDGGQIPSLNQKVRYLDPTFNGSIVRYSDTALNEKITNFFDFPTINSIVPSWDNDSRKNGSGFVMYGATPDHYGKWLKRTIRYAHETQGDEPFVFLNAWNEWAEGTVLEPSRPLGYAYLNQTSKVLATYDKLEEGRSTAVIVHIAAPVDVEELFTHLDKIIDGADIFITTIAKYESLLSELKKLIPSALIRVVANRGRDVFPFFFTTGRFSHNYDQLLKISIEEDQDTKNILDKLLPQEKLAELRDKLRSDSDLIITASDTSFWASANYSAAVRDNRWIIEDFRPEIGQGKNSLVMGEERSLKSVLGIESSEEVSF